MKTEIKFIYNSNDLQEREAFAYATSLDQHVINEVDLTKATFTRRQLADLAKKGGLSIEDLFDKSSEYYKEHLEGRNFEEHDELHLLTSHPEVLKTPIIEYADEIKVLGSAYDTNELDMIFNDISVEMSNKDEK